MGFGSDQSGAIATSTDGKNWVERSLGSAGSLNGVAYGNGRIVVVVYGGTSLASDDGVNWSQRQSVTSANFSAVTYGNGQFVAVGDGIVSSTNGVNWTRRQFSDHEWSERNRFR